MKVHTRMRAGFPEVVYQRCLCIEFEQQQISFKKELPLSLIYENQIVGKRKVDFLVDEKIVVELKAQSELTDAHLAQALNYLEIYKMEVGLLINFGAKNLQFKRLFNRQKQI